MKKICFFYWYVPEFYWHPIYDLHLKNLYNFKDVFDEITFVIAYDEFTNAVTKTVESIGYFIPEAKFLLTINDKEKRESKFFYEEIAYKMGEFPDDVAIFFAHNKGVDTVYVPLKDRNEWVESLYFLNLHDVDKINSALSNECVCAAGSARLKNYAPPQFKGWCKYEWMYTGTFFWIVPKRVYNYAQKHDIKIDFEVGRYSTEGFLGAIFPDDAIECYRFNNDKTLKENFEEYLRRVLTNEELEEFMRINDKKWKK